MTKRKNQFVNARGQVIDTDDDVCPDGFGITTSMMLMDGGLDDTQREIARTFSRRHFTDALGRSHQPGHRFALDTSSELQDAAEGAREIRKRQLSDAWRTNMAHAAALKSVASDIEGHAQEEADREDADAARASAFQKKWTGAFEADDAAWQPTPTADLVPFKPSPDVDLAGVRSDSYKAAVERASNAWKTSSARVAENYPADLVRQATRLAPALNISKPYEKTMTANLAVQAPERVLAARKSHDAATDGVDARDAAFAEYEKRQTEAWRAA